LPKESVAVHSLWGDIVVYSVYVDSWFWVCHSVPASDGQAEPAHGHNFCATAKLTSKNLDNRAMVADFCRLRQSLDQITADIAGSGNIGRIDYFAKNGQTAEIMAKHIFQRFKTLLPPDIVLVEIIVTEEPFCRACYTE
jgi:6-pyruvoyl-tetrahydropterin synthase